MAIMAPSHLRSWSGGHPPPCRLFRSGAERSYSPFVPGLAHVCESFGLEDGIEALDDWPTGGVPCLCSDRNVYGFQLFLLWHRATTSGILSEFCGSPPIFGSARDFFCAGRRRILAKRRLENRRCGTLAFALAHHWRGQLSHI